MWFSEATGPACQADLAYDSAEHRLECQSSHREHMPSAELWGHPDSLLVSPQMRRHLSGFRSTRVAPHLVAGL